ncbi:MAG: NAD-dependent epimerase/dehydratase family protein, partial [Desulfobacterales bacterium]
MRYLITGATGFVGPHLVKRLVESGHSCRCLVRPDSHAEGLIARGVELVTGDITQAETLVGFADGADCLLHLATLGHMHNFSVTASMFEAINVEG